MLIVILFTVVALVFGHQVGKELDDHKDHFMFSYTFGTLGFVLGAMVAIIMGFVFTGPEDFEEVTTTKDLISLNSQANASGSFFLGIGSVSDTKRYYYFVDTPKGVNSRSVCAGDSYITETDSTEPKIVKYRYQLKKDPLSLSSLYIRAGVLSPDEYNKIYIPEGSIKRQYSPN